jgi:hypothetical protein
MTASDCQRSSAPARQPRRLADAASSSGRNAEPAAMVAMSSDQQSAGVIVQYDVPGQIQQRIVTLRPGETVTFGHEPGDAGRTLTLEQTGVPRRAGVITAAMDHWLLTNLSHDRTLLVDNPEGAGEHVKVTPRRIDAPIPFEIARLLVPAGGGSVKLVVFAAQHRFLDPDSRTSAGGTTTSPAFALDETAKYFLVLVALCEPRLRDSVSMGLPTDEEIVARLRHLPGCGELTRSAINFHLEYLTHTKLCLRHPAGDKPRSRRADLATFALRFDLVHFDHLRLLAGAGSSRVAGDRRVSSRTS